MNAAPDVLRTGAVSFKRLLGCAPQVIARVRPLRALEEHSPYPALRQNCDAEWTEAPNLRIRRRAPHATGLSLGKRLRSEPNRPDGCRLCCES